MQPRPQRLSEEFRLLSYLSRREGATLEDVRHVLAARGHALIALLFSLPFFIPIPLPGLSLVLGPVIIWTGGLMLLGRPPWLPRRVLRARIDRPGVARALRIAGRLFRRIERAFIRPRGKILTATPTISRWNGFLIACCGLLLALPLPPGTNWPPAVACGLLCIGILEDDGLFVGIGYLVALLTALLFGAGMAFGLGWMIRLFRDWV